MRRCAVPGQFHPSAAPALIPLLPLVLSTFATAQSLEPRAYSPSPVGAKFAAIALAESTGPVVLDPSIPITDVSARLRIAAAGFGYTFDFFGRQALITAALPFLRGTVAGKVNEEAQSIYRSGLGDLQTKLSVNLVGNPALSPGAFAKDRPRFTLGTSLTIVAPTGQYMPSKLINIGTHRWAFKPEVGISYPWDRFLFDLYAGVWYFTPNTSFYTGQSTRRQDPLLTCQGHVSYTFRPRLWLAVASTWYGGGAASVNDGPSKDRLDNSRAGATLSLPVDRAQSVKLNYSQGITARFGQNFKTIGVAYQVVWF